MTSRALFDNIPASVFPAYSGTDGEETSLNASDPMTNRKDQELTAASRMGNGDNINALAAVMRKAERKESVTIAVIGGSITEGTISSGNRDSMIREKKTYAEIFFEWWQKNFPETGFHFLNAGIGATDSYLGVHRVQRDVLDCKPDLVLVEFSVNDENSIKTKTTYDNLIRRILQDEQQPAVILLFMAQTNGTSAQAVHADVGKQYSLPMISYQNVMLYLMRKGILTAGDLSGDEVHPSALGHRIAGEIIRERLEEVYAVRNSAMEPAAFIPAPATKEKYQNARILDHTSLVTDLCEGYQPYHCFSRFPNGWISKDGHGVITFKGSFASLGILWLRQVNGRCGRINILVDRKREATLDGSFPEGWGDYAAAREVYTSGQTAEHLVEIMPADGADSGTFILLGILLSDQH